MTGMHACNDHAAAFLACWQFSRGRTLHAGIFHAHRDAGLYGHLVDIIWILSFPLLYLISRHS